MRVLPPVDEPWHSLDSPLVADHLPREPVFAPVMLPPARTAPDILNFNVDIYCAVSPISHSL